MKLRRIDSNRFLFWFGKSMVKVETGLRLDSFGVGLELGGDEGIDFYIKAGVCLYLTLSLTFLSRLNRWFAEKYGEREYSIRWFDGSLWWDFHQKYMEWSCRDKWWQRQTFHVTEWIIGKAKYQSELISTHRVAIPFPEGSYTWDIEIRRDTWARPRWPKQTIIRCHANCEGGTPSGHKGPDYGLTCPAKNVYEAVGEITAGIYRSRGTFNAVERLEP